MAQCSATDTKHSLEVKLNYFLTNWLKLAREIRAESSDTFQKPYTAGCIASHYYLSVQFPNLQPDPAKAWLFLIVATALSVLFIQRQYSANQYKYFAHFLNSGSCFLHGRCSISDSHIDEDILMWQMPKKKNKTKNPNQTKNPKPTGSQICHKRIQDISSYTQCIINSHFRKT